MKTQNRIIFQRILYAALLAFALGAAALSPFKFESGIFEMAEGGGADARIETLKKNSSKIRIAISGESQSAVFEAAEKAAEILGAEKNDGEIKPTLGVLAAHSNFLLSPADRELLKNGEFEKIRERAKDKILSPYSSSLFKISKDPFFLLDEYAKSLLGGADGWRAHGGFLARQSGENFCAALIFDSQSLSDAQLEALLAKLRAAKENFAKNGVSMFASGARIHSLHAAKKSKSEINMLSAISLALVFLIGFRAFGSLKIFIPVALCLGAAFAAAFSATVLIFKNPHVCVLIFATSLIGLSIDYSYHYFYACKKNGPDEALKKISTPLKNTLITTLVCFLFLAFSDLKILREISVFSIFGLLAAYFFVRLFYPPLAKALKPKLSQREFSFPRKISKKIYVFAVVLCAILSAIGIFAANFKTEAKALYTPQKSLINDDIEAAKILGSASSKLAIIEANSPDEIAQIEENCGIAGLSRFLPSQKRQMENEKLIANLYASQAKNLQNSIGAKKEFAMPQNQKFLKAEDFCGTPIAEALSAMLCKTGGGKCAAVVPVDAGFKGAEGVEIFEPAEFLNGFFGSCARSALILAGLSFSMIIPIFALIFGRKFLKLALPIALAAGVAIFILSASGSNINLFHILALFIMAGLGIDYAIFHNSSPTN
ncbi:MAG: hypothetical protein IKO42_04455, partial [Opitutales bacterium]|nr:hypothetical protein [Opitutales bacterium]